MQFQINRDVLLKSLSVAHNIIERKNTLPILSNVLLEIKKDKLNIVATDLDILFIDEITDFKFSKDGKQFIEEVNKERYDVVKIGDYVKKESKTFGLQITPTSDSTDNT